MTTRFFADYHQFHKPSSEQQDFLELNDLDADHLIVAADGKKSVLRRARLDQPQALKNALVRLVRHIDQGAGREFIRTPVDALDEGMDGNEVREAAVTLMNLADQSIALHVPMGVLRVREEP